HLQPKFSSQDAHRMVQADTRAREKQPENASLLSYVAGHIRCWRSACPVRRAGCGNGVMVEPLRHRQTKGAETDMSDLQPPRYISTPPKLGKARVEHNESAMPRENETARAVGRRG